MKNLLMLCLAFALLSCGEKPKEQPQPATDLTLDCWDAGEDKGLYQLYFKPSNGETGDPMPYYDPKTSEYHCFFLLEPYDGSAFRNHIFDTRTKDFASFGNVTETFPTGTDDERDQWIGTGSCVEKDGTYYFYYSTLNSKFNPAQSVMLATSTNLRNWTKHDGFMGPPAGYNGFDYRDPLVYWDDTRNKYVMLVTSTRIEGGAVLLRYESDNLTATDWTKSWKEIEPLVAVTGEPQKYQIQSDSRVLECPDMFKMGDKWYLVFSRINADKHRKTFYRVADSPDGPWHQVKDETGHHETFDGLYLYAAKTVSNGTDRYLCGWASSGQRVGGNGELAWAGMLVSHKLEQQSNGRLYPTVPPAVDALFAQTAECKELKRVGVVSDGSNAFTLDDESMVVFNRNASSFKIEMHIDASQAEKGFGIGFAACDNQRSTYNIEFDLTADNADGTPALYMKHWEEEYNFTPLVVPADKQFDVKIIAEKCVCVTYVNNQVAFANRIEDMEQNPWMIYTSSGKVKFSNIKVSKK